MLAATHLVAFRSSVGIYKIESFSRRAIPPAHEFQDPPVAPPSVGVGWIARLMRESASRVAHRALRAARARIAAMSTCTCVRRQQSRAITGFAAGRRGIAAMALRSARPSRATHDARRATHHLHVVQRAARRIHPRPATRGELSKNPRERDFSTRPVPESLGWNVRASIFRSALLRLVHACAQS